MIHVEKGLSLARTQVSCKIHNAESVEFHHELVIYVEKGLSLVRTQGSCKIHNAESVEFRIRNRHYPLLLGELRQI